MTVRGPFATPSSSAAWASRGSRSLWTSFAPRGDGAGGVVVAARPQRVQPSPQRFAVLADLGL